MHGRLLIVALVATLMLPLAAAPQDFACANADTCTEALRLGVPGSLERLTALAEGGDSDAQLRLGFYYYGVLKTPSQPSGDSWLQGTKWLRMAAAQGNPEALFQAGSLMEIDRARFFHFAAEQGYAPAQLELAFHYSAKGDLVQYRKWYLLAIKDLPNAFRTEADRAPEMTPAQIAESDRLAREWKPKTWAELRAAEGAN
jgi:TPR repeat protein